MGANPDVSVKVLTRHPEIWRTEILGMHKDMVVVGCPDLITADPAAALEEADLVFLAAPAFAHDDIITSIKDYVPPRAWLGALPAPGFFDWAVSSAIPGCRIFGAQRSPYNCRVTIPGHQVEIIGVVPRLSLSVSPRQFGAELAELVETALSLPTAVLDNFLCSTLSPSTSIFHTARTFSLLRDWNGERSYAEVPLLYEQWDDVASELYLECEAELLAVCGRIPADMSGVVPASAHYGVATPAALTSRIRSLEGLRGIPVQMKAFQSGYLPDTRCRLFLEDFPFGVEAIRTLAQIVGIDTPVLDAMDAWRSKPPILPSTETIAIGCARRISGRSLSEIVRRAAQ
jgi:hypothetical protein